MSAVRSVLLLLLSVVLSLLVVSVSGQGSCPAADSEANCGLLEVTTPSNYRISVSFDYDINNGQICTIDTGSITKPGSGNTATQTAVIPQQTPVAGSFVTVTGSGVNGVAQTINLQFAITTIGGAVSGGGSLGPDATHPSATALTGSTNLAFLTYSPFGIDEQVETATSSNDNCGASTFGDPHFLGFHGQEFNVFGKLNGIMKIYSDSSMQLNGRLIQLLDGASMSEISMKLARLASNDALPHTKWFDHAGDYIGEVGVALPGGRRLYVKAGAYRVGFNTVRLDDMEMPVSKVGIVIGEGENAVTLTRVSLYRIKVTTPYVSLSITNSDNFINIDHARLEREYNAKVHPISGALGQTADPEFKTLNGDVAWQATIEDGARVESDNLFEQSTVQPQAQ